MEIERIKQKISCLDEFEAKSLLLITYVNLDNAINGNGEIEVKERLVKELFEDLTDIYTKK